MTVAKPAREVAVEFMLQQGRHFCENSYCDCIDRLAERIQWERSVGATIERERAERERLEAERFVPEATTKKRPLAKATHVGATQIRKAQ